MFISILQLLVYYLQVVLNYRLFQATLFEQLEKFQELQNTTSNAAVEEAKPFSNASFEQLVGRYQLAGWDLSSFCYTLAQFTQANPDRFVSPLQVQ